MSLEGIETIFSNFEKNFKLEIKRNNDPRTRKITDVEETGEPTTPQYTTPIKREEEREGKGSEAKNPQLKETDSITYQEKLSVHAKLQTFKL